MAWGASSPQDIAIAMAVKLTGEENLQKLSGGLSQIDKAARSAASSSAVGVSAATKSLALAERTLQQGLAETQRGEDLLTAIASKSARTRSTIRYQEMAANANAIKANGQATTAYAQKMVDLHKQELAAAQAAEQASNQGTSSLLGNLSKVAAAVALAVAAFKTFQKVVGELWSLAEDAAPLETIRLSFEHLTEGQGDILGAMEAATLGMTSQVEMMQKYNMASQLMEDNVARRLPEAMGYLTKVGAATGMQMDYMLTSLVTGIGRLSYRYLDNIGVVVKLEDATKRAAAAYGIEENAVTQAQKQEALMAITIEQLAANTAHIPNLMGSATQSVQAYAAAKKNAANAIGEAFLPALEKILPPLTELVTQLANFVIPTVSDFAQKIGQAGANAIKMISAITTLIERQRELNELKAAELSTKLPEGVNEDMAARLLMQRVYTEDNLVQALRNRIIAEANHIRMQQMAAAAEESRTRQMQLMLATEQQMQTETYNTTIAIEKEVQGWYRFDDVVDASKEHSKSFNDMLEGVRNSFKFSFSGIYDDVISITQDGQSKLLEMQAKWAAQEKTEQQNLTIETITQAQDRALKMAEIETKYRSEMAALQQEGDAGKIAKAQQSHQIELLELSNKFAQEDAISRRAMLIERYQQANARIAELNALRNANRAKIVEAIAQAGAEQGLTEAQINARLTALGLQLSAEQQIAVERALLNKAILENDERATKKYIDLIEARILAAKYAQEKAAADALEAIRGIQLPALELPPMQYFGGAGGGEAAKKTETVAESLEATIGRISDTLSSAIATLAEVAEYKAKDLTAGMQALADNLEEAITIMMHTAWKFGDSERDWRDIPKAAAEFAGWASNVASAFGTAASTLTNVAEYKIKDISAQLVAIAQGTQDIITTTQQVLDWFKSNNENWRAVAEEISAFAQYAALAVGWIGPAVKALEALAEYGKLGYKSIERTQKGIDYLYVNTKALLGMLQVLAPDWGKTAKKIKDLVGYIADSVSPVEDMADALAAVEEYGATKPGEHLEALRVGINYMYVNTQELLGMLQVLAPDWGKTAKKIKDLVGHIGNAVEPVKDIADALAAIAEYGQTEPGASTEQFTAGVRWMYVKTQELLAMLRVLAPDWGETAKQIELLMLPIGNSVKPVKDIADALAAVAEYGATKPGASTVQFTAGVRWMYKLTKELLGMLQVLAPDWGDTADLIDEQAKAIGSAVSPVKDMAEALAAVAEYGGTKPGASTQEFTAGINWMYKNTNELLGMLIPLANKWKTDLTQGVQDAATAVKTVIEPVTELIDALTAIAEYKQAKDLEAKIDTFLADTDIVVTKLRDHYAKTQENILEANKQAAKAATSVSDMLEPASTIVEALTSISEYKAPKNMDKKVGRMISDARTIGRALIRWFQTWKSSTWENVDMGGTAMGKLDAMFAPIKNIVDSVAGIAEYQGASAAKVTMFLDSAVTITGLISEWVTNRGPEFGEQLDRFAEFTSPVLTKWAEALGPINSILDMASGILDITKDKAYQIQFPITAALDALIAISEEVRLWVFNQGPGFKKRMLALKKQTTGPLNAMIEALTPMQNLISMASSLASEKDWALAKTFQANIGPALEAIVKGMNNAIDALNKSEVRESLYDTGFATGQDLGLGIIAGINSMILPVQAAVSTIYGAAGGGGIGTSPGIPPDVPPLGPVNTVPVVYQNHINITGNTFVGSDNATIQLIASLVEARIMAHVTRRTAGAATQ